MISDGRHYVFSGYYGMRSFGDDLFAWAAAESESYWRPRSIRINSPPLVALGTSFSVPAFADTIYVSHSMLGAGLRLVSSAASAISADRFIFCGGSLYSDSRTGTKKLSEMIAGSRCSAIGVSIGPFASVAAEARVARALRRYEFISVRDRASYDWLRGANLQTKICLAADLAGVLEFPPRSWARATGKSIGFVPCNWNRSVLGSPRAACDSFVDAVSGMRADAPVRVVVLNLNDHPRVGDRNLCNYVVQKLGERRVEARLVNYRDVGVAQAIQEIANQDLVVSGRMHGAIAAYLAGVPFVLMEYHDKCKEFSDFVEQPPRMRIKSIDQIAEAVAAGCQDGCLPGMGRERYSEMATRNFTEAPWYEA